MDIGIVGLPQSGKRTFFDLLTYCPDKSNQLSEKRGLQVGESIVRDPRFDKLVKMYNPKKISPAKIHYTLFSALQKDSQHNNPILSGFDHVEVICHIVRAFNEGSIFHIEGSIDPLRDIRMVNSELLLKDILFTEKHIDNLKKHMKSKKDPHREKELELFEKIEEILNREEFLNKITFSDEEKKLLHNYQFLTRKNQIIVLNVDDDKVSDTGILEEIKSKINNPMIYFMQISAKIEDELLRLESEQERQEFLTDLGIKEPALNQLTRLCYEALGLISFFTVGESEVHMWSIPKNTPAPQAAGTIHSDMERGFIRAEVIKCEDLLRLGSEQEVKNAGLLMVKGKDYIVEDGDILHIRFNV